MFKFLLILIVLTWLFFKVGGFLFRIVAGRDYQKERQAYKKPKGGNVFVNNEDVKNKKDGYSGGEYVDYEEVD